MRINSIHCRYNGMHQGNGFQAIAGRYNLISQRSIEMDLTKRRFLGAVALAVLLFVFAFTPASFAGWNKAHSGGGGDGCGWAGTLTNPSLIVVAMARGSTETDPPTDTSGNTYVDCGPGWIQMTGGYGFRCYYAINTDTGTNPVITYHSSGS